MQAIDISGYGAEGEIFCLKEIETEGIILSFCKSYSLTERILGTAD